MDPEIKQMLQETLTLAEENNKLLHKVRGVQKREALWQILKLAIIAGIAIGAFYYIEPYLTKMMDLYSSVTGMEQNIKGLSDGSIIDLLKNI